MINDREEIKNMNYENISDSEIEALENEVISEDIMKKLISNYSVDLYEEDKNVINLQNKSIKDILSSEVPLRDEYESIKKDYVNLLTKGENTLFTFVSFTPFTQNIVGVHIENSVQNHKVILTDKSIVIVGANHINKPLTAAKYSYEDLELIHLDRLRKDYFSITLHLKNGTYYFLVCNAEDFNEFYRTIPKDKIKIIKNETYKLRAFLWYTLWAEIGLYIPMLSFESFTVGKGYFGLVIVTAIALVITHIKLRKRGKDL